MSVQLPRGAIEFDQVSKQYRLGAQGTLRGTDAALFRRHQGTGDGRQTLWAIRDATFRIAPGESLGLIGPNGSGKTTTLKLLSRITQPTRGQIHVPGKVSALIEVGAGFHPELTGRENIYLNGAILGLRRQEITQKLEAIIAFSELERFIDTPVKRYSSGMYVRLGFAIAAHVEPDILLVDEVLAVGDAAFRQKCIARMEELRQTGITILFVSHNMHMVKRLCDRALFLWEGRVLQDGTPGEVISAYEQLLQERSALQTGVRRTVQGTEVEVLDVKTLDRDNMPRHSFAHGESLRISATCVTSSPIVAPVVRVRLISGNGSVVAMMATHHSRELDSASFALMGKTELSLVIPSVELVSGTYSVELRIMDTTDSQVLAAGYSELFSVDSPGFAYEVDRGTYSPRVIWHLPQTHGES